MSGIFSWILSIFGSSNGRKSVKAKATTKPKKKTVEVSDSDKVTQPSTFSILTAQYGFYTTILGNIDDQQPLTAQQKLSQTAVKKALGKKELRMKSIPRLPSVIPKLLQSIRDPNAALNDYVKVINKDPALTTSVLKLANSVYFNPVAKRVTSIETAVVKLGDDGLRSVLSAAVMQPVIQRKSHYYSEFGHKLWMHSLCCAVACETIATQRRLEPFKAYLLGLVHDIGKITIFSELAAQFQSNNKAEQPGYAAFAPMMQSDSETLSHTVAQDWELPEEICSALKQQINLKVGTTIDEYANLLYQANLACEIYAIAKFDEDEYDAALQALEDMKLPMDLFEKLDSIALKV